MSRRESARDTLVAYLFLTPAILGLILMTILPIIGVAIIGMTNWSGLEPPAFVGLSNFVEIFTSDNFFYPSVVSTLYFAIGSVVVGTIYAFAVALMLNQSVRARGLFRSIFFLPYVVPIIGTSVVWGWMYESNFGVINFFLSLIGIHKVQWLGNDATATPAMIVMTVWGLGNFIVIFLAGLQSVPRTFLEAVEIDGGNAWHKFRHITIPLMSPIIFFNVLMSMVANLQVFVPAYTLTRGGPNNATLYMVYLIFREGFQRNNFGHAAALSLIFFVFIAAVTGLIFGTSRRWLFYEGN